MRRFLAIRSNVLGSYLTLCNQNVGEVEFSVLTRTLEISIKFVRLSSFNKILNRSNPFNILGLMNVREFFLAHLVKFNDLQDVFNFHCL